MASPFDKQPSYWMRLSSTKEFFKALDNDRGIPRSAELVVVRRGGNRNHNQSTCMHEIVTTECPLIVLHASHRETFKVIYNFHVYLYPNMPA